MAGSRLHAAGTRLRIAAWRIITAAVAATAAWWLAQHLLDQPAPIFAPIAAMVCLLDEPGTRGHRAFRMLGGVLVGVAVGEVLVGILGDQPWSVGLAMAIASLLVATVSINPLVVIQAGVAALLVVGLHLPETGFSRVWSALIGAGLALAISQVLWSPSPITMLSVALRTALTPIGRALHGCARALAERDTGAVKEALGTVRASYAELSTFDSVRTNSHLVVIRTVRGRRQRRRFERFHARTARLEHIHTGTLLLCRSTELAVREDPDAPQELVDAVEDLARAVDLLAEDPTSEWRCRRAHELLDAPRHLADDAASVPLGMLTREVRQIAKDFDRVTGC